MVDDNLLCLPDFLLEILKAYAGLWPVRTLTFPSYVSFNQMHDFFLRSLLLNPHFVRYPPSAQYQLTFWKWALQNLEHLLGCEDAEIDERIYTHLIDLMPGVHAKATIGVVPPSETSYTTYLWKSQGAQGNAFGPGLHSVTIRESRTIIERGTTGLRTWSASYALADYLLSHEDAVRGKRVLELGSGTGFLGSVVAALQHPDTEHISPSELWLTDVDVEVLRRCRDNMALPCNASSFNAKLYCQLLDWADAMDPNTRHLLADRFGAMEIDVLLGADLVYHPSISSSLVETIRLALESGRSSTTKRIALIALTIRNEDTFSQFMHTAAQRLTVEDINYQCGSTFGNPTELDKYQQINIFRVSL